jgi:hypothetical protein
MADCSCNNFPATLGAVTFDADVTVAGNLGVGTSSPSAPLTVSGSEEIAGTFSTDQAVALNVVSAHTTATSGAVYGATFNVYDQHSDAGTMNAVYGFFSQTFYEGTNSSTTTSNLIGSLYRNEIQNNSFFGDTPAAGTIERAIGCQIDPLVANNTNSVAVGSALGIHIANQGNPGNGTTVANTYGLYVEEASGAAGNNFNIYSDGAGSSNYFGGNLLVGGAIKDGSGVNTLVDSGGCYYAA